MEKQHPVRSEDHLSRRGFLRATTLAPGAAFMLTPGSCHFEDNAAGHSIDRRPDTTTQTHDVGPIFSKGNKSYFPMMLGNGIDNILIGYSGAMGACQAHEAWNYGNMNMETVTGWYRSDIRRRPALDVVNLLQCSYVVRRGIHADGIEYSEQEFDAKKGLLTTRCALGYADVQVTTFITRDHILVHRFAVVAHNDEMAMQFFLRSARPSPLRVKIHPRGEHPVAAGQENLDFTVEGEGWPDTPGRLFCDHPQTSRVICYNRQTGLEVPLSGQSEFTFAVQCSLVQDVIGGAPPVQLRDHFDYDTSLQHHCAEWDEFHSRSAIHLSHNDIGDIYDTSLFAVRAHQHPVLGGITVGSYPGMWNNTVYSFDMSFSIMGLLGANRMKEAELGVQLWKRILPNMAKRARDAGLPGVCKDSDMSLSGEFNPVSREKILEERHIDTALISLQVWQLYQYSGHLSVLKEYWDVLVEPLRFLIGACVEEFDNHAEIIRSSGPNGKERIDGKVVHYPNPTYSLLTTIEALRGVCDASDLLGREIDPHWRVILPKLERGVEANRFDGVLHEARSPRASVTGIASMLGLFNVLLDNETLLAQVERQTSREGYLTWTNHGYRAVPWSMCDVSAAFSRRGIEGAGSYVEMAAKFTTTLNGFPEAIRPDGVYVKPWYPTVHGDFIHAVNLLLVSRRDETIELFPGIPDDWGAAAFKSLRVPVGLLVSASRTNGAVTAQVTNDSDHRQRFTLRAFGRAAWEKTVILEPGESASLPQ